MDYIDIFIKVFEILLLLYFIERIRFIFGKNYEQKVRLIVGPTGVGKTSFAMASQEVYYNKYDNYIHECLYPIYERYRNNGFPNLRMPETFAYSDCYHKLKNGLKTNFFDFSDLPNLLVDDEFMDVEKLPIGAYCVFDDIANKCDCRNYSETRDELSGVLRLHRKGYYSFDFVYPNFDDVDKRIKSNCHEIIYILNQRHFVNPFSKKILATKWDYVIYSGQNKEMYFKKGITFWSKFICFVRRFFGFAVPVDFRSFWYFGDIYTTYDSRSEISYFMKGVYSYKENKLDDFDYSRRFINKYCVQHPVFIPYEQTKKGKKMIEQQKLKESLKKKKELENE